jgi:hypothetical protein
LARLPGSRAERQFPEPSNIAKEFFWRSHRRHVRESSFANTAPEHHGKRYA